MPEDLNILTDAVLDIDGHEIAAAGVAIGKATLSSVAEKGFGTGARQSLADAGVLADFEAAFSDPDLENFFDNALQEKVLAVLARLTFPEPVFRELEAMRQKSPILYAHSVATTVLTVRVVMEIVIKTEDLVRIAAGVLLKDIGMTRVPRPVTKNKDFLSKQQFHHIRKHPVIGLLINTYYLGEGIEGMVALRHHMRNGAGYPKWGGLKPSKLIDLIEVVDIYYALISPRPFRPVPFDSRGAIDELTQMAKKAEISEDALRIFVMCLRSGHPNPESIDLSSERLGFVPESNFYGTGPEE